MHEEEEEEMDTGLWMLTFSDLLSLLLTFFVLLFALKALDKGKLDEFLGHFRGGGMGILQMGKEVSVAPIQHPGETIISSKVFSLAELRKAIDVSVKNLAVEEKVSYRSDERGMVLTLPSTILFKSGTSDITPEAKSILDKLSKILRESRYNIIIEGHTDNIPISTEQFPSNWELSTDRAVKVLRYLVESRKLPPERFAAVGYGASKPLVPNIDAESRKRNRRVELILAPPGNG